MLFVLVLFVLVLFVLAAKGERRARWPSRAA
jgi:hypothetical protein